MHIPPKPPVGHIVAYEYLWCSQTDRREDGAKTYPVAVVVAREDRGPLTLAYVVAISHTPSREPDGALAVPRKLKRHLGLDEAPSWIHTDEINVFAWPGPDLRPAERLSSLPQARGTCVVGALPSDWFADLLRHIEANARRKTVRTVGRSR